jgi:signal transduction histidine kinase
VIDHDLATFSRLESIETILNLLCKTTGLRLAVVARVTSETWTACAVLDNLNFGLKTGQNLDLADTYCNTVRCLDGPIVISHASAHSEWKNHPGFTVFGVESYIAVPLRRRDQSFFGVLCALDTRPTKLSEDYLDIFYLLANLVAFEMEAEERGEHQNRELEMAREATRVRDQFVGILGHDLRNPLNAIAVASGVLQTDPALTEENLMLARVIEKSGRRMSRLVEDTLDLTRSQVAGGISINPSPNDLGEVCLQVLNELRVVHPQREIIFEDQGDGHGYFDESRAAQVISNLLSNALQHGIENQEVRLTLRGDAKNIIVEVHNFGKPIPVEKQHSLFDPFQRGTLPREEAMGSGGLGLGLYIAREIMRAHGGDISLTSDENGTTFSTYWPRHKSA